MSPWMRKLHKWVGLIIALQFTIWLGSGLVMSLLDHNTVQGHKHRAHTAEVVRAWPVDLLPPATALARAQRPVQTIETFWLEAKPVYRLTDKQDAWLVDARSGHLATIDDRTALSIARKDYIGDGQAGAPTALAQPDLETRKHEGAIWRVPFSDDDDTTIYISARDGRILERRNRSWRLFDFVWMLHIMDYSGRENFNNPLVVSAAFGGLWMALSGVWLLFVSFHLSDFVPARWRPRRELSVYAPDGTKLRSVESHSGDSVYVALARSGLQLPSNCGGGQSCGLCEVRFRGRAPAPTSADRAQLDESKLKQGYRLACNLPVIGDTSVEVPGGAALWTERAGVVERVVAVTPFLREIVIKPEAAADEFRPGAYLQIHVPQFRLSRGDLNHPEHHREDWHALDLPETFGSNERVRRSYSLALPVQKANGHITLLARFSPGRHDKKRHPPGKGSSYLYSLKAGDVVRFSGPFGDFALKPGNAEKVFIGGGAGMAPLRAMIHALLDNGATERIHFWYGARSLRDAPYLDEMAALAAKHRNFLWHPVLSEEVAGGSGLVEGLVHHVVHDALLRNHPELGGCEFYLCGPPAMLAATRQMLASLGVSEARVAYDDFKI